MSVSTTRNSIHKPKIINLKQYLDYGENALQKYHSNWNENIQPDRIVLMYAAFICLVGLQTQFQLNGFDFWMRRSILSPIWFDELAYFRSARRHPLCGRMWKEQIITIEVAASCRALSTHFKRNGCVIERWSESLVLLIFQKSDSNTNTTRSTQWMKSPSQSTSIFVIYITAATRSSAVFEFISNWICENNNKSAWSTF